LEADLTPAETAIHAVYPHKRLLSAKVRAFVDFLVEKYQPVPYWEIESDSAVVPEIAPDLAPDLVTAK
jgi:hypothetical protein